MHTLQTLKARVAERAILESSQVDKTLKRCAVSLAAFTLSTLAIVALLVRANRARLRVLDSLRSTNEALEISNEVENQRAFILEMVSKHAALGRTLGKIAELAPKYNRGAGVAVWAATGTELLFQVARNLPAELTDVFESARLAEADLKPERIAGLTSDWRHRAARLGLAAAALKPLHDDAGRLIGLLHVLAPEAGRPISGAILNQMAQLASIAIQNTLLEERLAFQAQHDTLTGLANRLLFHDRVQHSLRLAARHETGAAVILVDLDRFKQVNDTLGHRVGDELLREVAGRLEASLRQSDAVARISGDEFTILANDIRTEADAETVAAKILASLARPMKLGDHEIAITATAGISIFPEHGEDAAALLRHADLAMYDAKRAGGDSYCLFRAALGDSVARRIRVEQALKTALQRDEFSLQYQPLVDRNGEVAALEALLRWNNPALGPVSPAELIPIAEEMGLILAIGEWVTRSVCRQGSRWLSAGYDVPRLAINASPMQLLQNSFALMIRRTLEDCGFPPSGFEVEITETALMNNLEQVLEQIEVLRALGVTFAIDDFGTGYSSLSQLRTLPVDRVKVDRSFIKDLDTEASGSSTLVRGIIALAHNLHLEVVAEGVETAGQLHLLHAMGCDVIQGFLLHRPMAPDAVEQLLQRAAAVKNAEVNPVCDPAPA